MIKKLVYTLWGIQSLTLIKIHKAFIFSKLDYGVSLFLTVKQSFKKKLKSIRNTEI